MSLFVFLADLYRSLCPNYGRTAFHGDRVYQSLISELIESVPISLFVETGTFLGNSTGFVASRHPNLLVWSCEVNPEFFARAKRRLRRLRNVSLYLMSSEEFTKMVLSQCLVEGVPLFFLDSHWYDYWPLQDEIAAIYYSGIPCVTVIDDFQVPDRTEFGFEVETTIDGQDQICNMDMISGVMDRRNHYHIAFPTYSRYDAFSAAGRGQLRGHVVIFQNLQHVFDRLSASLFMQKYYQFTSHR